MGRRVKVWKAAPGAQFDNEKAGIYGPALENVERKSGRLTAQVVVNAARPLNSPLHDAFEWGDSAAAEQWRNQQARHLINHLRYEIVVRGEPVLESKGFFSVRVAADGDGEERQYVRASVVAKSENLREQVIADALEEAKAWRLRYAEYQELEKIVAAIDELAAVSA